MPEQRTRALLISVGEDPTPVINSINELRPESLCFFSSEENRAIINNDIIPALKDRPVWLGEIITPDASDLLACYRAITEKWQELQQNWRLEPGDWMIDYTEGTKPRVAALILATLNESSCLRYAGGNEHTMTISQINPWSELAIVRRREAARLFSRAHYGQAVEILKGLIQRVSGGEKHIYKALSDIAEGYRLWDNFQYRSAWEKLKPSQKSLEMAMVFGGPSALMAGLKGLAKTLKDNLLFLEKLAISTSEIGRELLLDLISNARRRAEFESKYDDALVRLCRAVEIHAQIRLGTHGIKASDVKGEQIPSDLRNKFVQKYTDEMDNRIKLPLFAAYRVLQVANDPSARAFFDNWPQLKLLLDHRDRSVLVKGSEPFKRERYEEMFKLACKICGVEEGSIPWFPEITL